ncbi:hypothetical protein BCR41DRAFT_79807 [Lobosporangium transversale]|uniref:Uncharacterized protein n=1 Tax=Lobosporangium transversale TaxID=64571 RepID=A0A1Y2GNJ1_9FUNG|nr:hypothetical protein BCR41DRAFT_79807 [Lobosporangium transversale]ORZ14927.1 hypothetical protein BCR41DRAFT_79807 [Lobosporangium transversale]|eukprot:XP_021881059.1 hypothetical protein BCR41DRAFT_79807 [Lobosporangium transversale]
MGKYFRRILLSLSAKTREYPISIELHLSAPSSGNNINGHAEDIENIGSIVKMEEINIKTEVSASVPESIISGKGVQRVIYNSDDNKDKEWEADDHSMSEGTSNSEAESEHHGNETLFSSRRKRHADISIESSIICEDLSDLDSSFDGDRGDIYNINE